MMRAVIMVLAAGTAAQAAWAACPVAADMERGVRLELKRGDVEAFRATSPVLVESRLTLGGGTESRFTYARGLYLLESVELENGAPVPGSRATFALPVRPEETPQPQPGAGWGVQMVATYGDAPVKEMLGIRFGAATEVTIGECTYAAIPIEQRIYEDGALVALEQRNYLPDLGFSYAVSWKEDDQLDTYEYLTIEAME